MDKVPFDRSYWVIPGKLLAGCYPGTKDNIGAEPRLSAIISAGVRIFINLMEEHERDYAGHHFTSYFPVAERVALDLGEAVEMKRFPIKDLSVPDDPALVSEIIAEIDRNIEDGRGVYVHCLGGRGRTGLVIGCYLLEKGMADRSDVFDVLDSLRRDVAQDGNSPEMPAQFDFVRRWKNL